jgi:hypothetical protein
MKKRKAEEREEGYLFKVTLSDWSGRVRGMPYRILAIPEEFTLYELAETITDAFNFDFDHAFGFYDNIKSWTDSVERYESSTGIIGELEDNRNAARTKVNEVFDEPGKKLLFFTITVMSGISSFNSKKQRLLRRILSIHKLLNPRKSAPAIR